MLYSTHKKTASIAVAEQTTRLKKDGFLKQIEFKLAEAAAEAQELAVSLSHGETDEYDITLLTQDMNTYTQLVWTPNKETPMLAGSSIKVTYPNAALVKYTLRIITERKV